MRAASYCICGQDASVGTGAGTQAQISRAAHAVMAVLCAREQAAKDGRSRMLEGDGAIELCKEPAPGNARSASCWIVRDGTGPAARLPRLLTASLVLVLQAKGTVPLERLRARLLGSVAYSTGLELVDA